MIVKDFSGKEWIPLEDGTQIPPKDFNFQVPLPFVILNGQQVDIIQGLREYTALAEYWHQRYASLQAEHNALKERYANLKAGEPDGES